MTVHATAAKATTPPTTTADVEFTAFMRADSGRLLRAAFLLTGDQQLAEDLLQDALSRTYRAWHRLRSPDNAAAYARRTMYHLQVSWWRRRRVAEQLTVDDRTPAALGRDVALEVALRAALLKLPPAQRAAIVLRFFEDRTEAEAARILRCGKSTIHSRVQRGLRKLATLLPELETDLT